MSSVHDLFEAWKLILAACNLMQTESGMTNFSVDFLVQHQLIHLYTVYFCFEAWVKTS